MVDYSWVTDEAFDAKLREIVEESGWDVPGVYPLLREYYNNAVLTELEKEREYADDQSQADDG